MPKNGTVAYVSKLPTCDLHGDHEARYDLKIPGDGRWGNVCEELYDGWGRPELGLGRGQRLEVAQPSGGADLLKGQSS